jgi:hypothetical protein
MDRLASKISARQNIISNFQDHLKIIWKKHLSLVTLIFGLLTCIMIANGAMTPIKFSFLSQILFEVSTSGLVHGTTSTCTFRGILLGTSPFARLSTNGFQVLATNGYHLYT